MTMQTRPEPRVTGVKPTEGYTLAVVGSRSWPSEAFVTNQLSRLLRKSYDMAGMAEEPHLVLTAVVSGGARGVDQMAARWALRNGIYLIEHLPEWDRLGKRAGFVRNEYIIQDADYVVAFMMRGSKGTQMSVDIAKRTDKSVHVFTEKDLS